MSLSDKRDRKSIGYLAGHPATTPCYLTLGDRVAAWGPVIGSPVVMSGDTSKFTVIPGSPRMNDAPITLGDETHAADTVFYFEVQSESLHTGDVKVLINVRTGTHLDTIDRNIRMFEYRLLYPNFRVPK